MTMKPTRRGFFAGLFGAAVAAPAVAKALKEVPLVERKAPKLEVRDYDLLGICASGSASTALMYSCTCGTGESWVIGESDDYYDFDDEYDLDDDT